EKLQSLTQFRKLIEVVKVPGRIMLTKCLAPRPQSRRLRPTQRLRGERKFMKSKGLELGDLA
ncbi:MAG: hypothetical protein ACO3LE_10725, partial [Bdellovibrionota bacterium]